MEKVKKVVIIGGHATPAIALIDDLEKKSNLRIYFFGRRHSTEGDNADSMEYKFLADRKNVSFVQITSGRLQRSFTIHTIPSLTKIPVGFFQSFFHLVRIKPNVVVGFGGYLSVPIIISAAILRIPIFIHEQTSIPGLSIKITAKFASKVFISFKRSQKYFDSKKTIFSGNLLRKEILSPASVCDPELKNFLSRKHTQIIYVTGGGQGSRMLNNFIIDNLEKLFTTRFSFIIQTGSLDNQQSFNLLSEKISRHPDKANRFFVRQHFTSQQVAGIFQKKPIVFGRSGANTVCEIVFFKLKAIFVPLDIAAGSEQMVNAKLLANSDLARIIPASALNVDSFLDSLNSLNALDPKSSGDQINEEIRIDTDGILSRAVISTI